MIGLKPCPFCGGKAKMQVKIDRLLGNKYVAFCVDRHCNGRIYRKYTTERAAVAAWNERAENVQHGYNATPTHPADHSRELKKQYCYACQAWINAYLCSNSKSDYFGCETNSKFGCDAWAERSVEP